MSEIFQMNLAYAFKNQDFKRRGVKLVKMKPAELKDCVSEALRHIISKKKVNSISQKKFVKNFYKNIKKYKPQKKYHGKIKSVFLRTFVNRNLNLLK